MLRHKGTQRIETRRLILRKFQPSDAASMDRNYARDPRVTKFLTWQPYEKREDIEKFVAQVMAEYEEPNVYHWAIELDGDMTGRIRTVWYMGF